MTNGLVFLLYAKLKSAIDDIKQHGLYSFKGAVSTVADLPATGNEQGDAYDVDGSTYVWNGEEWIGIGSNMDFLGLYVDEDGYICQKLDDEVV